MRIHDDRAPSFQMVSLPSRNHSAVRARVLAVCFELSRLEEMMAERGLSTDHSTIYRWVQAYAPELEKRCRPHLKAPTDSWRVNETSIKMKKVWVYL